MPLKLLSGFLFANLLSDVQLAIPSLLSMSADLHDSFFLGSLFLFLKHFSTLGLFGGIRENQNQK